MKLTFYEGSKICDERDQQLHFETETFALWSQNLRLILRVLAGGLKACDQPSDHPGLSLETKVSLSRSSMLFCKYVRGGLPLRG